MQQKKIVKQLIKKGVSPQAISRLFNEYAEPRQKYSLPINAADNGNIATAKIATDSGLALDNNSLMINDDSLYANNLDLEQITTRFIGWGALSILAQNGIVQNIIQTISSDCVREWGELKYTGDKDIGDKLKILEKRMVDLKFRTVYKEAIEKTWLFGGCLVYPKIVGDDAKGERAMPLPITKDKIKLNSFKRLKVIEPLYCSPVRFNANDPFSQYFYEVQEYNIMGVQINADRVCKFMANNPPLLLKPVYQFFGISPIQLAISKIVGFTETYNNIVEIIGKYNLNVLKTNSVALSNLLNGSVDIDDVNSIKARIALFNKLRTNFGVLMLDQESEEWQQFNMNLTTLDKLLNQNLELISAVTRIPATKLYGSSPQGFGSTGQHELTNYYDLIRTTNSSVGKPHLEYWIKLLQLSEFGEIDDDIKFVFNPLDSPSAVELSQINLTKAQTLITLNGGQAVTTVEESREVLAKDEDSGFDGIDTSLTINLEDDSDGEDTGNE